MIFSKWTVDKRTVNMALFLTSLLLILIVSLSLLSSGDNQPVLKEVVVQKNEASKKQDASLRLAAVGDFGAGANAKAVLTTIAKEAPDYTLALGDLSYGEVNEQEWCGLVHETLGADHPFEIVAGNHDTDGVKIKTGKGHIYDFASCLPNRMSNMQGEYALNYYFDYKGLVRSVMISPDITLEGHEYSFLKGQPDYEWLKGVLDESKLQSIPWVIVGMHKNCITLGEKSCEIGTDLLDLLAEQKVDLVLQGHEHAYFRSKQLVVSAECPSLQPKGFKEVCVHEGVDNKEYKKGVGTLLAIPGTGGKELRDVDESRAEKGYFAFWSGKNNDPAYGPLIIDISNDTLSAYFSGIDGKKRDMFSVSK